MDAEFPYLAASPDRIVVEEDAIVEVKSPYKGRKGLTPYEATEAKLIKCLEIVNIRCNSTRALK
jgi:hypothetical protein